MCAHYENVREARTIQTQFKAAPLNAEAAATVRADVWPGYTGTFIVRPPEAEVGDEAVAERIALPGVFGLLPHWARDDKLSRHTYNARSETAAEKPSFRDAWRKARHCIIPAQAIYEPDWRSGRAVATRIVRADGKPLGIAGLWDRWRSPEGRWIYSYTMLTVNADSHPFMNRFHKPSDEKRMVVVLSEEAQAGWLKADSNGARGFMSACPPEWLATEPAPGGSTTS